MSTAETAQTCFIRAANGVRFAYRILNQNSNSQPPLVMHIHFRANMDFWDPLLINSLAAKRTVVLFDQSGVGRSDGVVPITFQGWADNVIALCEALQMSRIDLLGFSMGGYAVQMVALTKPELVRKLIIAGSGPSSPSGIQSGIVWPRDIAPVEAITSLKSAETDAEIEEALVVSFFSKDQQGRRATRAYLDRIRLRTVESSKGETPILTFLNQQASSKQYEAAKHFSKPDPRNSFDRLGELKMPVLVINGDNDLLIPTSRSWELLHEIENAQMIIYPKAGHGFIWQHAERVAQDINRFLDEDLHNLVSPKL